MRGKVEASPPELPPEIEASLASGRRIVLMTGHRRENFGAGFESIFQAITMLARRFPEVYFIYPVHPNPQVREMAFRLLGGANQNVILTAPLAYGQFLRLMISAHLLLTDSGGLQEEGPSLGKPVLVMREVTERPEGLEAGVNRLVGMQTDDIVDAVAELLDDDAKYQRMARAVNPFGDGLASRRIAAILAGDQYAPFSTEISIP
jgi:UDP-N-acetylglucosamine 2-epimerase